MRSSTANGVTLVEVVAALALMGTLLAVILVGGSKHLRQLKAAERKRESVRRLDDFLATWSVRNFDPSAIPDAVQRSGLPVTGHYGVHGLREPNLGTSVEYQVDLERAQSSEFDSASIVRLTVSAPHGELGRKPTAWAEVLVSR